jgi:hypothetical protein
LRTRVVALDPLEQGLTLQMQIDLWRDGLLVAAEERSLRASLYFKHELLLLLERTGFHSIAVHGGYAGTRATPDNDFLVFIATK